MTAQDQKKVTTIAIKEVPMELRFYATASFYADTGDLQGVSKSSVSRVVRDISTVLVQKSCALSRRFEENVPVHSHLLGDSGYPLRPYLLTPILNPSTRQDERYNHSHQRGNSIIKRSFRVLKSRFRCIDVSGGGHQFAPEHVCHIFVVVVVLHNICVSNNLPEDNPIGQHFDDNNDVHAEAAGDSRQIRNNFFEGLYGVSN
eukprot:XP_011670434.1 PREDICTED: putative nuclease HARBI1 [Strongylocentrotus purpuratus]